MFVGYALAKLSKAAWESDEVNDTLTKCKYEWVIYHKNGRIERSIGKIDTFWKAMGVRQNSELARGIKLGPVGYVHERNTFEWTAIKTEEQWQKRLDQWLSVAANEEVV